MAAKIYEMPQNNASLSEKELRFLAALLGTSTLEAACKRCRISHDTGRRLLSQPRVKAAYETACRDIFAAEIQRLQRIAGQAITLLVDTLTGDDANPTKVRAAQILLQTSIELNKISGLEARMLELETRLNERQQNGAIK